MDKQLTQLRGLGVFAIADFLAADVCTELRCQVRTAHGSAARIVRKGLDQVDEAIRRTMLVVLPREVVSAVGARLTPLLPTLQEHFGVPLTDYEAPQFLAYRTGDYFRPHQDRARGSNLSTLVERRRVSVIVFLNGQRDALDPYGGGELFLYQLSGRITWDTSRTKVIGETGLLIAFPADIFHQVMPVRWGERYTMVSWFY